MELQLNDLTPPTFHDVLMARKRISAYLPPTPVFKSPSMDEIFGFKALVKCENLQPTGAFKVRGGINLVSSMPKEQASRGLITASSGNHGQSIAYAGNVFGAPVVVYVPRGTEPLKIQGMRTLGAEVVVDGRDFDEAREMAEERAEREGMYYVETGNEPKLIAGVGTAALELIEEVPDLDVLIVPIGGGTGACGAGLVCRTLNPEIRMIGVQAEGADAVYRSWKSGELLRREEVNTIADGLATRVAFSLPFVMLQEVLDDFLLVDDDQMISAMEFLLEMGHLVAEAAGAASTAAAMSLKDELKGKKVGIMLSGGNVNAKRLLELLEE